jgi:hypothetical protein
MHQRGGLERVAGGFARHFRGSEAFKCGSRKTPLEPLSNTSISRPVATFQKRIV